MARPLKLFYSKRRNGEVNFGDDISPILVSRLTGRNVIHARVSGCEIAAIGSIIEMIAERRKKRLLRARISPIKVWGSGCLYPGNSISKFLMEPLALRGSITADRLGSKGVPLGDPGLLFDRLIEPSRKKLFKWGVIAHYSDDGLPALRRLLENTAHAVIIPVSAAPLETLRLISQCEFIASSSLHGLVAADCYHIPNIRIKLSTNMEATNSKFLDYASGIGRKNISEIPIPETGNLDDEIDRATSAASYFPNIDTVARRLEKALLDSI